MQRGGREEINKKKLNVSASWQLFSLYQQKQSCRIRRRHRRRERKKPAEPKIEKRMAIWQPSKRETKKAASEIAEKRQYSEKWPKLIWKSNLA